jgi:DNA-binding transcriptional regulator GbsR (MarR family)
MVSIVGKQGKKRLYLSTTSFIESFERALKDLMEKDIKPLISLLSSSMAEVKDKKVKKRFNTLINEYKETNKFLNIFLRLLSARKTFSVSKLKGYLAQKIV